jgi:AraC-like DNA-binding protein
MKQNNSAQTRILLVKNMVCTRCLLTVEEILKKASVAYEKVLLGEIHLNGPLLDNRRQELQEDLKRVGFELIDNHTGSLVEKLKRYVILKARNEAGPDNRLKLSVYLSAKLNYEYTHLSSLFSMVEGKTIENFFIDQRIEKAKELLVYGQMTLSQIARELDYSSPAHLSSQFKKVTGLTPSHFRDVGAAKRKSIDNV